MQDMKLISAQRKMKMKEEIIAAGLNLIPHLLHLPSARIWCDYDEEADVLYISFRRPQHADQSEMDDNVILHYSEEQIVGITVIGAKATQMTGNSA